MLGPHVVAAGLSPRRERDAPAPWADETERPASGVCDLCESAGPTSEEYGLQVCSLCAEQLLP